MDGKTGGNSIMSDQEETIQKLVEEVNQLRLQNSYLKELVRRYRSHLPELAPTPEQVKLMGGYPV